MRRASHIPAKTTEKRSMRAKVDNLIVAGPAAVLAALHLVADDLREAGGIAQFTTSEAAELVISVELGEEEPKPAP